MGHNVHVVVLAVAALGGCARTPDLPPFPSPPVVPRLADPHVGYRQLGMFASQGDVRFIGDVAVLAGNQDSLVVLVGLSLPNLALTFRQHPDYFEAEYEVQVRVGRGDSVVVHRNSKEVVRVATFSETRRDEESLLFQQTLQVPPGQWTLHVRVSDGYGSRSDSVSTLLRALPEVVTAVVVHEVMPRKGSADFPRMLVNPTHTVWYPVDTATVYLEVSLSIRQGVRLHLRDAGGYDLWTDSVHVDRSQAELATAVVRIPASVAPIGAYWLDVLIGDRAAAARVPLVVATPGLPGVTSLPELRSVLRYFGGGGLEGVDSSDPAVRAEAWHQFWLETDPDLDTPGNEALEAYFGRVREAAGRYEEAGWPGWLTDRGMVYLAIGPPDREEPARLAPGGGRVIQWRYRTGDLTTVTLAFEDPESVGRFRLTEAARRTFERLRISRQSGS